MGEHSRYNVGENETGEVLKNKLGIKDQKTLEDTETLLLSDTYEYFLRFLDAWKLKFNVELIFDIHEYFLGTLYEWAGEIRKVELSKGGVLFCASLQIGKSLKYFDKILRENMPLSSDNKKIVSKKLAIIHCEFNAIHPFREGNGRTIRLFLDLVARNCGFGLINYGKNSKENYIKASIAGMNQDYTKMEKILYKGLS